MNKRQLIGIFLIVVVFAVLPTWAFGQMGDVNNNREIYKKQINQIIVCCKSKCHMVNSEHQNIRRSGELALKKGDFCKNFREQLIDEMVRINLPPKIYKINYYINSKFFELERDNVLIEQKY